MPKKRKADIIHNYLTTLIDYIKFNDLHQYLDIVLLNFLKCENIKVSPEYIEQLISFHKLNMLNSEHIADDLINLINKK